MMNDKLTTEDDEKLITLFDKANDKELLKILGWLKIEFTSRGFKNKVKDIKRLSALLGNQ